jgi:hypothetical protein
MKNTSRRADMPVIMKTKLDEEVWKDIPNTDYYQASSHGRIRSVDRWVRFNSGYGIRKGKILKPVIHHSGYIIYGIVAGNKISSVYGHQLVARTFLGEPQNNQVVCHYDGNKANNCLANLRYDTRSSNEQDKRRHGTYQKEEKNPRAKLSLDDIYNIRHRRANGETVKQLADEYGFRSGHISKICIGMLWPHAAGPLTREFTKNA